ncbi:U-box domain-containing protein 33 [Morella rubra]|uniref:RING-type E3 ubiquitin transferase n=1 Tax=Morella rubra TaxID=262757 RepID=A0A6A1VNI7_9ROSI|nr:U-box domain-containing protein 33 [Morella rubra]
MIMASRHEVLEDSRARVSTEESEDMIYFAVRKEVNKCALNLLWLLRNSGGKRICILHVHKPAKRIPGLVLGGSYPVHALTETQVNALKLYIEMESVEKGIVELIYQHGIRELVMGAAADGRYKKYKLPNNNFFHHDGST